MRTVAGLLLVVVLAGACESTSDLGDLEFNLEVVSGDQQTGFAFAELPDPLVVRVTNPRGGPVRGQIVNYRVTRGGGTVFAGAALTNERGIAQDWWTLGAAGPQALEVRAVDSHTGEKVVFATFTAQAISRPQLSHIQALDPKDGEWKFNGSVTYPQTLVGTAVAVVVRAVDENTTPIPDIRIDFAVTINDGTVSPTWAITDENGVAETSWTIGTVAGDNRLAVRHFFSTGGFFEVGLWVTGVDP